MTNKSKWVRVKPGDIVGSVEAADILGVERTRVARYRKTGVLPQPWDEIRASPLWLRRDVAKVARKRAKEAEARAKAEAAKAKAEGE